MKPMNRRDMLKMSSATSLAALASTSTAAFGSSAPIVAEHAATPKWEVFEVVLQGPSSGNPFVDVKFSATFALEHRSVMIDGFYDGAGTYKLRFMPDTEGHWTYTTSSSAAELNGKSGKFECVAAKPNVHGPMRVRNVHHFGYADGTPFYPFGTTCYAWINQSEALQRETLESLRNSPFNKIRMCVFPKSYQYNHNEPALYPFARNSAGVSDFTQLNPAYFKHVEDRINDLCALGIEADLILFHPYDRWGYASMPAEADDRYLRYVLARMSCYRNIWWSLANEFDLMHKKTTSDFDRFFHIIEEKDPYSHLRSVHFSHVMYNYAQPWVTHASLQNLEFASATTYIDQWHKPVMYDEVMYEGNLNSRWGNLAGEEMSRRFWLGVIGGCYVTHGETLLDPAQALDDKATPTLWWSHGGTLHGTSPRQIAFLRKLLDEMNESGTAKVSGLRPGLEGQANPYYLNATVYATDGKTAHAILYYFSTLR